MVTSVDRAQGFLDRWEADHVEAVPNNQRAHEAELLKTMCLEDAQRAGIAAHDLETAAGGDLLQSMISALEAAARGRISHLIPCVFLPFNRAMATD